MLEVLKKTLHTCPIVKRGEYTYFIHPITDGVPLVEPALLRDVACSLFKALDFSNVDKIIVTEAMGIHIGTVLSLMTDIPYTIIRKREYNLPGEVVIGQTTGYSKGTLYLNSVFEGDRVVVVDDVISTGGTIRAVLPAIESTGAIITDLCFVINRGNPDIGRPYKSLVTIDVDEDGVHVIDSYF
ncbi:MAG: purine phosphoribosyltransferase family protein [Methanocalculus sp. MSAO_Arc1]|uniref:hypoxanthine/guanine phosphoribosyltransferase n=1 Tax=Methanocalculus TaxID=71151 RepID=UPI000FF238EF|nr:MULTISPECIES: hypoxanthine/guanine phosphoribosyltransferase [unclassified Methanocalculus]MCP1662937.1 adenine phosphoribosyltransferase [Methanocalculus sp. AMF5]RQD82120.1 MAG: purine phosphoribosyltransferase family protein [Methanocalculus sp. MSAO_Arc1]